MSGHSKWSKVKHQKATTDVAKAAAFTKASHVITIAVREGGNITDPNLNFRLRLAIEKAHSVNMPKENIERIIEKAKGGGGVGLTTVMYEAYGPGGVAMLIEATTDNANRTVSAVKNTLEHNGGSMVAQGAVSFQFDRSGVIVVAKGGRTLDEFLLSAIDAGAEDVVETDEHFEVYTKFHDTAKVRDTLEKQKGNSIENMELIMKPKNPISCEGGIQEKLFMLEEQLENLDDVQQVYTNVQ